MVKDNLLIGVISDHRTFDELDFNLVGDKYLRAVTDAMHATPIIFPVILTQQNINTLLNLVDGLLFTGSPSNISPHYYGEENIEDKPIRDAKRDTTALYLMDKALERKLPVFGICRGFQEINVALGGSLHQDIRHDPTLLQHSPSASDTIEQKYLPKHDINIMADSLLANCTTNKTELVNSIHMQSIKKLSDRLIVEAIAPDNLVEAYRLNSKDHFLLAVQWHPEWLVTKNKFSLKLFQQFKTACISYRHSNKINNQL
ncbi:gamma-glutamyl-gamma-aminobutyrate hydrolase family protein [Colwelliaceae bacterium 6441]